MKWLSPAFRPHPDIEALNDSGHKKFKSIHVKLGVAMTAMLRAGSDKAAELYLEVNRKANQYVRSDEGKIIKGRQIIAMMYESFRTRDRLGMIVSLDYLIKLHSVPEWQQASSVQADVVGDLDSYAPRGCTIRESIA